MRCCPCPLPSNPALLLAARLVALLLRTAVLLASRGVILPVSLPLGLASSLLGTERVVALLLRRLRDLPCGSVSFIHLSMQSTSCQPQHSVNLTNGTNAAASPCT